ncbi:MAG: CPBP family glutamic-type intramembrane protease [Planctomycetota bacterium]
MKTAFDVLGAELLQLARDRRALFSAILLPALLYPLLFWGMGKLEDVGRETMAERTVSARLDLAALGETMRDEFRGDLVERGPITIEDVDATAVRDAEEGEPRRLAARGALGLEGDGEGEETDDGADLLVVAEIEGEGADAQRATFELWYDVKSDDAREALSRARGALRDIEDRVATERRERLLGGDPATGLDPEVVDVATAEDTSGAALGKWLPFIVLLVLVSGAAYAALAVFAGEREAGTLETLLVQPVPHRSIAFGKFIAVFIAGAATLVVNLASLALCFGLGLADVDAFGGATGGLGLARLATLGIELPACLLLCALMCLACGGARTFREGQLLVFPVTLLVIVPTAIVLRPEAELTALWAVVPFAGTALALRDGLEGGLSLPLAALVVASHLGWTWLALTRLAGVLDAEKVLGGGGDAKAEAHLRQASGQHAVRWGFAVVMTVYLVAGSVQRWDLDAGLWFTFWILLPAFALAIAWTAPRAPGEKRDLAGAMGLRVPRIEHLVGALLVVPALARGAEALFEWQQKVLPLPPGAESSGLGLESVFGERGPLWLFFFFALSPGVFEELVFRGSLLSAMRRDWTLRKILFWQALYFALVHASIYRLLPTAILGALLTAVALRARSVFPAMVLHIAYNGLLVLGTTGHLDFVEADWFRYAPWLAVPGLLLLARPAKETTSGA